MAETCQPFDDFSRRILPFWGLGSSQTGLNTNRCLALKRETPQGGVGIDWIELVFKRNRALVNGLAEGIRTLEQQAV